MRSATLPPSLGAAAYYVERVFGARPFRTDGDLLALRFAADGSLWSVEEPGLLRRWDVDVREAVTLHPLEEPAILWAFSPNAERVAAASDVLTVWETATARRLASWTTPSWVTSVAFAGDEGLIATGHDDAVIRVWDLGRETPQFTLCGHDDAVSAAAFSPDGRLLASAGEDRVIRLWDVVRRRVIGELVGHTDRIPALAWHPDGRTLVSAGWDTTARVWDVESQEPVFLFNGHAGQVHALGFSPDGRRLACADGENAVTVWDFERKKTLSVLRNRTEVRGLAFSPDGGRLAAGVAGRRIVVWQPHWSGSADEEVDPLGSRSGLTVSPDGRRLAALAAGGSLRVWDTSSSKPATSLLDAGTLRTFAASGDGRWLAASQAVGDGPQIWNTPTTATVDAPRATLGLWDAVTGRRVARLDGQRAPITALAFSPDSSLLASAGYLSGDVWFWRIPSGEPELLAPELLDGCTVEALAFHPQGRWLAVCGVDWFSGGDDGRIVLWDVVSRRAALTFPVGATALAFNREGNRLAAAGSSNVILVYDVDTGRLRHELAGHLDAVGSVAFSPDGRWLASGGDDRTIRLWDAAVGLQRGFAELDTQIKAVAFGPDGRLFTGNGNGSCYQIDLGRLLG